MNILGERLLLAEGTAVNFSKNLKNTAYVFLILFLFFLPLFEAQKIFSVSYLFLLADGSSFTEKMP